MGLVSTERGAGIELEHDPGDLHVVARLEARGLERLDHPERPQALLHVAKRLVVVGVVPRDQPLDAPAVDAEDTGADLLDPVGVTLARAVDAVGGGQLAGRRVRRFGRHALEDRVAQLRRAPLRWRRS